MKSKRFQFAYRENASRGHRIVGEVLRTSKFFRGHKIYQEYQVSRINPNFKSNRHLYDWVILDLKVVIEVMGEQHENEKAFCINKTKAQMWEDFYQTKRNDRIKKKAALDVGFTYIEIPYKDIDIVDENYILDRIPNL